MRWIVAVRGCKWTMGLIWSQSLLILGVYLWTRVDGMSLLGLCFIAMGQYIAMSMLIDDFVQPVHPEVVNFLKLTAVLVFLMSGGFVLWRWQAMLFG